MSIQTTITPIANESTWGTTGITRGLAQGDKGRFVTLSATPREGYEFVRWETTREPVTLPASIYTNVVFGGRDLSSVCYATRTTPIGTILYVDENILYEDPEGVMRARDGYWELNNNQYIFINSGVVIQSGLCTTSETRSEDITRDIFNDTNRGRIADDIIIGDDINRDLRPDDVSDGDARGGIDLIPFI